MPPMTTKNRRSEIPPPELEFPPWAISGMSEPSTMTSSGPKPGFGGRSPAQKTAACGRRTPRLSFYCGWQVLATISTAGRSGSGRSSAPRTARSTCRAGCTRACCPCRSSSLQAVEGSRPCRPGRTPTQGRPGPRRSRGGASPCPKGPRVHCIRGARRRGPSEETGRSLGGLPEVGVCRRGGHAPTRGPLEEPELHQVRLVHVFHSVRLFPHGRRERGQSHRTSLELAHERFQDRDVELVQSSLVHLEQRQGLAGSVQGDPAVAPHLGEIADPSKEPVGDPWRPSRPSGDLAGALRIDLHPQDAGGPADDLRQIVGRVVVESGREPETLPQGQRDQARAGGGRDQGEPGKIEPDAPGRGALADDHVELEVLQGRIEDLLYRPGHPVHLVHEQDVAFLQVREDGGKVSCPLEGWS